MKQKSEGPNIETRGGKLIDITEKIIRFVQTSGVEQGLLTIFIRHTSASLIIQENADPDVLRDIEDFFSHLVLRDRSLYRHATEGPDDMPAHIRSALTQSSLSIPVENCAPVLGTWQAFYVFEHRDTSRRREVVMHIIGE